MSARSVASRSITALIACAVTTIVSPAWAGDPAPVVSGQPAKSAPLSAEAMGEISAGTEVSMLVLTKQQLTATTSNNIVNADTLLSGAVTFSPNALTGFAGIGNFVINTGANNSLQGAINVSVVSTAGG